MPGPAAYQPDVLTPSALPQPENMLIADATSSDPATPIKLADFGLSADITDSPLMHEPCGTPEYVGAFSTGCIPRGLEQVLIAASV